MYKDTWRTDKRKGDDREPAFGVGRLIHAQVTVAGLETRRTRLDSGRLRLEIAPLALSVSFMAWLCLG